ncbi:Protein of unknown function [Halomicrobium zhouii]|uniref:DUF2029 domain-containing protein n=1 Tax=Halomicrobium zhouii TaxID=767519 RepID=A0A1I6KZ57_9EURY|nr:glycosyltransferase family 87 protein [Halomicrobium zhouii]SFR96533.1 Protein of unknown function [Halomicrobium zhouii]
MSPDQNRRPVRAALAAGVCFGLAYLVAVPLLRPEQVGLATDVYFLAAERALAGDSPYLVAPPGRPGYEFVYQPVVVLAFVPHALTGSPLGAYLFQTALNLLSAGAIAVLLVRYVERSGADFDRLDRALVAGFVLASVHSISVFVMGQVNLQLALAVAAGGILLDRDSQAWAGAAFAAAATVKLFPAAVGLWLLRRRAWRAVAAAVVTGTALLLAGVLVFGPSLFQTYLTEVLAGESHTAEFAGGLDPSTMYVTVRRPLAALFPATDPALLTLAALALLVPVVVAASWDVSTRRGRLVALLATLLGAMLLLPLEPFYFSLLYYPLVPLLYLLDPGRVRGVFAAGTVLLSAVISYPAVEGLLALAPVSRGLSTTLAAITREIFRFAQPPLVGSLLLLAGCVLLQYQWATEDVSMEQADPRVE